MMRRVAMGVLSAFALASAAAQDEFTPEPIGVIERLPAVYPDHWVMVHDVSFFHFSEGEVLVMDPLEESVGRRYKGMMTASMIAGYRYGKKRNEHYVIETFWSRGTRGGDRTDVVAIYDPQTLAVTAEIEIPPKRISGIPKTHMFGFIGDERFLGIYNFTPAQSVSIVDLETRRFVAEVPTAGCGFVVPNGERSFTSICSNGTLLTSTLDEDGRLVRTHKSDVIFDAENDPIFENSVILDGIAYFPKFSGAVQPINLIGEKPRAMPVWWLTAEDERNWRPGGINFATTDSEGLGYVLMNPEGGEGTHKDGGAEVWVYDLPAGKRRARIELKNWGVSLGTSGTGDGRLLFVTNAEMGIDVYNIATGEFMHALQSGAQTPFLVYGTR